MLFGIGFLLSHPLSAERPDSVALRDAATTVDAFMNSGAYDSAQSWLSRIQDSLSDRRPSRFRYMLHSRQAEVYYYNNLHELGLQEATRGMAMAKRLNDSVLLADALNFRGLFFNNLDQPAAAIQSFRQGLAVCPPLPYPGVYVDLTTRYHLYGNLAEAFEHLEQPDSAIFYYRLALRSAKEARSPRAAASAGLGLGTAWLGIDRADAAGLFLDSALADAVAGREADMQLLIYSAQARVARKLGSTGKALALLDKGLGLLDEGPRINAYYQILFLDQAASLYRDYRLWERLATTLALKAELLEDTHERTASRYRNVLMHALRNETRMLNMQLARAEEGRELASTRLYLVILAGLLILAGFIAYRYYARQKLRLAGIRNKISQDLHDEVGATLSGIALYSHIARRQHDAVETGPLLQSLAIIDKNATDMVKKLSDIVWAVNPVHDNLRALMQRLEEYAVETAAARGMRLEVVHDAELDEVRLGMQQRKNVYLICREVINNAIKYSQASTIRISSAVKDKRLRIVISDDGTGFDFEAVKHGNGLTNIRRRAEETGAVVHFARLDQGGTEVLIVEHLKA